MLRLHVAVQVFVKRQAEDPALVAVFPRRQVEALRPELVAGVMFITEEKAGLCCYDTLEDFAKDWKAKKWEPQGAFCLELDQVEVLEVVQQEVKNDTRDQLRAKGFDLTPRKYSDKGGTASSSASSQPKRCQLS